MWERIKVLAGNPLYHYLLIALLAGLALLYLRYVPQTPPSYNPTPSPVAQAPEPKVVTRTVTRTIVKPGPERIVYLNKAELATSLKMPELNSTSDNALAAVTIPPSRGNTTTVALMNPVGETRLIYRQEPQKFLELKKSFQMNARYLFVGVNLAESEVVATPLRTGPVEWSAGVGVEVRRHDSSLGARGFVQATYQF